MASKINSRLKSDKARSGKPYDRPKQSIFRKVASAVRDVIVPSWLLNVPSWGRTTEEEVVPAAPSVETEAIAAAVSVESEVQDEVQDEVTESVSVTSKPSKRLRYATDNFEVEGTSKSRAAMMFSPSTVNSLSERVRNGAPNVAPSCELEKREPQLIVNGDDHSENSEGTASTSGCSSLISSHVDKPDHSFTSIKLSENALENLRTGLKGKGFLRFKKDAGVSTENSFSSTCDKSASHTDLSLWSRDSNMSFRNTLRPQSAFQSSRPSFSLTSFGGPSAVNTSSSAREKVSSPFYEGKTTYGGASAYRRAQLSSLPYQSSRTLRSKITVKPSHSSDNFECMSSAAKRILNTLEKMSTPLTDVKKIPNVKKSPADISASFTPASQRFNSYLPLSRRLPLSTSYSKGPPVSNITSSSRLSVLKNFPKISKNTKMEIPVHEHSTLPLDQAAQSPVPELEANKGGGGGGKIRTRINQHLHQSSKTKDVKEMPEEVHLPNIPLPVTDLPNFNFAYKDKPEVTISEENRTSLEPKESIRFTFADPIDISPPRAMLQSRLLSSGPSYTFSSPLSMSGNTTTSVSTKPSSEKEEVENKPEEKKETELYAGSVNDFLKTLREDSQKSAEKNSGKEKKNCFNTYKADKELLEPVDAGFGDKFKPEIGSWECFSCLVRNKPEADKCAACTASKPGSLDKPQSGASSLGSMFKPAPGTWECPSCLIRNKEDCKKCVACETLKPGFSASSVEKAKSHDMPGTVGFGVKFKPPPDSWECSSCLVRNKACDSKCICCGSGNTSAPKITSKESKIVTKVLPVGKPEAENVNSDKAFKGSLTAGSWECDACFVFNQVGQSKCSACETPRISTETTDSKKVSSGFSFRASAPAGSTPFRFGSLVASPVSSSLSTNFKFSDTSEAPKQQSSVQFGSVTLPATGSTSLSAASSEGFKFNPPTPVTSTESGNFKFGVPTSEVSLKPSEGLFKSEEPNTKSDKVLIPNSTATSGFAFGNLISDQNKTNDHSKTVTTETSEITAQKTEIDTVAKPNIPTNGAAAVQLPKPSPLFTSDAPASLTSISKAPCTTSTSTAVTTGGFIFGGNANGSQSQSTTTFLFGNKSDDIKTSSSTSAAETTTVFTSTATSDSISSPSPFIFNSQPNKQFAPSEVAAVNVAVDNRHGMSQETPVEVQSAPQVSSSSTLNFPPSSTPSQSTNFIFGSTTTPAATSSSSMFKFNSTVTTAPSTDSTPRNSGIFTFGVSSNTETKDPKPGFSFSNAGPEEKSQSLPQPQFSFNAFKQDVGNPVVTTSTSTATSTPFRFGAVNTPTPASTGFVFGAPKPDVSQTASSPFTFGAGVATKPLSNSSFGGFTPNQPVTTASVPSFPFGMVTSNAAPASGGFNAPNNNPSSVFTFGAKTTQVTPNPLNNSGALSHSVFGSPASQSVFSSNPSAIPSFGKPPEQKQEAPGNFTFGSSAPSQGPSFRFGSGQDGPQEKRHAAAPQPTGGFNFNLPQPTAMNNSSFNPTAPPTFNFGSTLSPNTTLFQFNADSTSGQSSSGARKFRKAVRRGVRKPD